MTAPKGQLFNSNEFICPFAINNDHKAIFKYALNTKQFCQVVQVLSKKQFYLKKNNLFSCWGIFNTYHKTSNFQLGCFVLLDLARNLVSQAQKAAHSYLMRFNKTKCKWLHLGQSNIGTSTGWGWRDGEQSCWEGFGGAGGGKTGGDLAM